MIARANVVPPSDTRAPSATQPPGPSERPHALLAAVVLLTFWPALLGTHVADDIRLLALNPAIRSADIGALLTQPMFGAQGGYWRPLTMLTFFAGDALGGAFGVHAIGLLLHVVNAWAVHALARRFVGASTATWVAALFAVHPVQVESVAWCAAVNDPLWVAATLQAMLAAIRWRENGARGLPWLACLCVFAAMLAKETGAVAIPLVVAAVWLLPSAGAAPGRRHLASLAAAVVATGALWFLLRSLVQREPVGALLLGPSVPAFDEFSPLRAVQVLGAQLWLLCWPWPTICVRSVAPWPDGSWWPVAGAVAAIAGLGWLLLAPLRKELRFAGLLVLAPLVPAALYGRVIGVYPIADRYLYLCVAGFALALAVLSRVGTWGVVRWLPIAVLALASFMATWNWRDAEGLVMHSLAGAPDDPMVLVMAGDLALERAYRGDGGALHDARTLYGRALAEVGETSRGEQARRAEAKARVQLGWCTLLRHKRGDSTPAEVISAFEAATQFAPREPTAWLGLGAANLELGRLDAAEAAFQQVLQIEPGSAPAASGIERVQAARRR
ncbi:MAG TPA: tetratricopeptide repeat protein [Planctomycetota bacterium]